MKLSSSASCGCCFCCYCRSWLMMLLMVSSVIHVSTDIRTTTTTTTTTNTDLNNYYKAMIKSAKFNTKVSGRTRGTIDASPTAMTLLSDANKGSRSKNIHEFHTALQLNVVTTKARGQAPTVSVRTPAETKTTISSAPESIAIQSQSLHETSPSRPRVESQRFAHNQVQGPSSDTYSHSLSPLPTGDNYDAVIPATHATDSLPQTTEKLRGVTATNHVQITILNGDIINNDSKTLKYPRVESNAREYHGTAEAATEISTTRQHTRRATSRPEGIHAVHETNQNYNNGQKGRNSKPELAIKAKNSSMTKTNPATVISRSNSNRNSITHVTSTNSFDDDVIPEMTSISTADDSFFVTHTPEVYSPHLQSRHTELLHLEYNQLKRPALLASTSPSISSLHRRVRQVEEDPVDKCRLFEQGDPEKMELYSPDYPNVYPKNINCTRVITAQKGQIIRLDFRNSFHIEEKEDCKFDFLEIRDGQYGFSNLIGKFCGTDFPPEITSKERYLWLHFHSDESIEYTGFTAVYEFMDRTRDAPSTDLNCTIEKHGDEGFVNSTDVPTEIREIVAANKIALDCMWRIQVQEKWKIQVKFIDFKLSKPNDCDVNFLDIFPEQTVMPLRVKNFCGSAGEGITSESNVLHMRFYAEQQAVNSTFAILYTAFREKGSGKCTEDEYDCEDATCIAAYLKCNQRDNCKFRWDEESCEPETKGQSEHMTIIITVFGLILGGMVITFLVNCVRKIMHDQKIIREHVRQSKESKLDEMGRNSKARSRDNISIMSPRQKHSQTSLQILDDVSNRYYREMELQAKGNFKEKEPHHIRRHDMIVQTSLCSNDDSSTTTTAEQAVAPGPCDMACQTRESLFGTAPLLRSKSKTSSMVGGHRSIDGVPPPPRFSTFGYDAAQMAAAAPMAPAVGAPSTLSRRNMLMPQGSIDAEHPPNQDQGPMVPTTQQPQQHHRHLHHRPSQEICHHHHQHQQQQAQKQTLPRHQHQHQHQHLQEQHHHPSSTGPHITTMPASGTTIVTAISAGSSAARARDPTAAAAAGQSGAGGASKNKQSKVDESKLFIDIRNSAPDVIIMTSH
uniref:CUB domain-containing protein n=1 Tax=Stomoxys calcitrans TaxID=35570 RepID=A0A1I8NNB7_STOCA